MKQVVIYTDGACKGNPGPGGWGALLEYNGRKKPLKGGEALTTNNRMELMAVIQALQALKRPCAVTLNVDSQYVLKGMTEWLPGWKAKGWRTASKQPVKNQELWQELDQLVNGSGHAIQRAVQAALHEVEGTYGIAVLCKDESDTLVVAIEAPRDSIVTGRNTEDQMLIGVYWGYVAMMEGLIARLRAEPGPFRVLGVKGALMPNSAMVYGLQDVRAYDGLGVEVGVLDHAHGAAAGHQSVDPFERRVIVAERP